MQLSAQQTKQAVGSLTILQRIAEADKSAVEECLDKHGNLVWALAKKFTDSIEEAETATQEIFLDIWKCAKRFDSSKHEETDFIILIVCRWLFKRKMNLSLDSAAALFDKNTNSARIAGYGEKLKPEPEGMN